MDDHAELPGLMGGLSLLSENVEPIDCVYVAVDAMTVALNAYLENAELACPPSAETMRMSTTHARRTPAMIEVMPCMQVEGGRFGFLEKHLRVCKAVIHDVDAAVHGRTRPGKEFPSPLPRGPFSRNKAPPLIHNVLDDIEDIVWVALWTAAKRPGATKREERWVSELESGDFDRVEVQKAAIYMFFQPYQFGPEHPATRQAQCQLSASFWPVFDIFRRWMHITMLGWQEDARTLSLDSDSESATERPPRETVLQRFVEYLKAGVDFLDAAGQYDPGSE